MFLAELDAPVTSLKGIGEARGSQLVRIGIRTQGDLLLHFPRAYEDRQTPVPLADWAKGNPVNTTVKVLAHDWFGWGKKRVLKVFIEDNTAQGVLVCYGRNFLERMLVPGKEFRVFGTFALRFGEIQCGSFDAEPAEGQNTGKSSFGRILPVYPLTAELTQKHLRSAVAQALKEGGIYVEDETQASVLKRFGVESKARALTAIHFPRNMEEAQKARTYLAFEELLYLHLNLYRRNEAVRSRQDTKVPYGKSGAVAALLDKVAGALPFELTKDQQTVFGEIRSDMLSPVPMARLLQGDVGSGKTLIAFLSACIAVAGGKQAAFMAPTELLARQHGENAAKLLAPAGVRIALLTGSVPANQRIELLKALAKGDIDLVIGTHALFSQDVAYKNLGLIIVDEQHRFGVGQRLALAEKTKGSGTADFLLMTATPIPRTLAQTLFSDLAGSTIRTMPPGRKPVVTHLARLGNEEKVYDYVEKELAKGRQAYFVYPLIRESAKTDLKDAQGMFENLKRRYKSVTVGLIHSKLKEEEKLATMRSFAEGSTAILTATSVVEVGVDVPNATCMIIEHAECFGLAALHQLRGRVGRGTHESYCFLVYGNNLSEEGKARIKVMKETADGFRIAEEDLLIRGPGDLTGTQQSGFLDLRIADLIKDRELSDAARETAADICGDDPGLLKAEHEVYRQVLSRANPFDPGLVSGV